jgi:putative PIN family toxin of toxin-antitoxin system
MKIVLDTNVLIAAFITRGVCNALLEHCVQQHTLVTSDYILSEFRRHLTGKFKYSVQEAAEAIRLLQSKMEVVIPDVLDVATCRDPADDTILGTATASKAVCIITGDKDLLVLKQFSAVDIVHPSDFAEYEAQHNEKIARL